MLVVLDCPNVLIVAKQVNSPSSQNMLSKFTPDDVSNAGIDVRAELEFHALIKSVTEEQSSGAAKLTILGQ